MSKEMHTTRDGTRMRIADMDDRHLLNTTRMLERVAEQGVLKMMGGGDSPENFWYDEEVVYGSEALEALGYDAYVTEARRRKLFEEETK